MSHDEFKEASYPSSRQLTSDMGKIGLAKHHVKALLEVDITESWEIISQSRRTGRKISFLAWMLKVIADCVAEHPQVAGTNLPSRNQILYSDNVDISIMVEKSVNGVLVPLPYVVRNANQKSYFQIQDEIEQVKTQSTESGTNYVLGNDSGPVWLKMFTRLPQWIRLGLMRGFLRNPERAKETMGSVMVTTVGMVGHTRGWIVPYSIHPICLALGSINEQPSIYKGEIVKRRFLHITFLVDHDVVDGMPAARFMDDLVKRIEAGAGLV